jgi:hypothetical protein
MKKLILSLLIITGAAVSCYAQQEKDMREFSVGINAGLPFGDAADKYNFMTGVTAKYEFPTQTNVLKVVALTGLDIFSIKDPKKQADKDSFIPVEFGGKFLIHNFYLEGDAGLSISTNSPSSNYTGQALGFVYSPTVGYTLHTLDLQAVDFSLRYEGRTSSPGTINMVSLRVAYRFTFLKRTY